ncbi:MAG: hypothetical protein QFX40_05655 [Archaeoglobales archaeon]|nr:hypothetical protein [Archaeoglobales archaeon]
MMEDIFKTFKTFEEFLMKLIDPKTYLGELSEEEIKDSIEKYYSGIFSIFQLNFDYSTKIWQKIFAGDVENVLATYLEYLSKLEDVVNKMSDNVLYSAYINALNSNYLRFLTTLQNINGAILHNLGLVSRKDIVALAEAYVDLKGDIKKETRVVRKDIAEIKNMLVELQKEMVGKEKKD